MGLGARDGLPADVAVGYIARKIVFWRLAAWSKKTETQIDDIIIESIKTPLVIWFVMLGLYLGASDPDTASGSGHPG